MSSSQPGSDTAASTGSGGGGGGGSGGGARKKFLICGDCRGHLDVLAEKVVKLNQSKAGPFDAVLCVGEFFQNGVQKEATDADLLAPFLHGEKAFPIPLFFVTANTSNYLEEKDGSDSVELCPNITWLGASGISNVLGFHVAFLSGKYDKGAYVSGGEEKFDGYYKKADASKIKSALKDGCCVDFLLTCEWGQGLASEVSEGSSLMDTVAKPQPSRSPVVADIARFVSPRYHFAGMDGVYVKLPPYDNPHGSPVAVTRFVGLGKVSDKVTTDKSRKWLHALGLIPGCESAEQALKERPQGTVACPYVPFVGNTGYESIKPPAFPLSHVQAADGNLVFPGGVVMPPLLSAPGAFTAERAAQLSRESRRVGSNQFFFRTKRRGGICHRRPQLKRKRQNYIPARPDCWFCLGSPACEKHLILSVGFGVYLTLPKGGISPGHTLLVPVKHIASLVDAPKEVAEEMDKFKSCLRKFYDVHGEVPMFVERSIVTTGAHRHAYLEAIPIPKPISGKVAPALLRKAKSFSMKLQSLVDKSLDVAVGEKREYFHFEMPDGTEYVSVIDQTASEEEAAAASRPKVPLQFGRAVACTALGCPERSFWKDCVVDAKEETRLAEEFRKAFEKFDDVVPNES